MPEEVICEDEEERAVMLSSGCSVSRWHSFARQAARGWGTPSEGEFPASILIRTWRRRMAVRRAGSAMEESEA